MPPMPSNRLVPSGFLAHGSTELQQHQQGERQPKARRCRLPVFLIQPQYQRSADHLATARRHRLNHAAETAFAVWQDDARLSIAQPYTADIAESKTQQARSSGKFRVMSVAGHQPEHRRKPQRRRQQPAAKPSEPPAGRRSISAATTPSPLRYRRLNVSSSVGSGCNRGFQNSDQRDQIKPVSVNL